MKIRKLTCFGLVMSGGRKGRCAVGEHKGHSRRGHQDVEAMHFESEGASREMRSGPRSKQK